MLVTYYIWLCKPQWCKCIVLLAEEATKVVAKAIYFLRVHLGCDFGNFQLIQFLLLLFWLGNKGR